MGNKKRVLFVCTGNSARSQMAEALLKNMAGDRYEVQSAGTNPRDSVHPLTVEVMNELGIDVSKQSPKHVDRFVGEDFDYIIIVCDRAKEQCPALPNTETIYWSFDDPVDVAPEKQAEMFRRVRDAISYRLRLFRLATRT